MKSKGFVHKYGDNIDTDVIIPARYLNITDKKELAKHCMEDIDPEFISKVRPGDIVVGGKNFGCGSSREHAPMVLLEAGVSCVIAVNFARIFYRNAINIGLPILECPDAYGSISAGDELAVDFNSGEVKNLTNAESFRTQPFPEFIQRIIKAGGLLSWIQQSQGGGVSVWI